jgi:hypothetical protein
MMPRKVEMPIGEWKSKSANPDGKHPRLNTYGALPARMEGM